MSNAYVDPKISISNYIIPFFFFTSLAEVKKYPLPLGFTFVVFGCDFNRNGGFGDGCLIFIVDVGLILIDCRTLTHQQILKWGWVGWGGVGWGWK